MSPLEDYPVNAQVACSATGVFREEKPLSHIRAAPSAGFDLSKACGKAMPCNAHNIETYRTIAIKRHMTVEYAACLACAAFDLEQNFESWLSWLKTSAQTSKEVKCVAPRASHITEDAPASSWLRTRCCTCTMEKLSTYDRSKYFKTKIQ